MNCKLHIANICINYMKNTCSISHVLHHVDENISTNCRHVHIIMCLKISERDIIVNNP